MPPREKNTAPDDLGTKQPANSADLDALRAEVAAEPDAADDTMAIPIGDQVVRVKSFLDWPASADDDMAEGRLTRWARKIIVADDFAAIWVPMDPTNRQVVEFITNLEKISGVPFVTGHASPTS